MRLEREEIHEDAVEFKVRYRDGSRGVGWGYGLCARVCAGVFSSELCLVGV